MTKPDYIQCPVCSKGKILGPKNPKNKKDISSLKRECAKALHKAGFSYREIMIFIGWKSTRSVQKALKVKTSTVPVSKTAGQVIAEKAVKALDSGVYNSEDIWPVVSEMIDESILSTRNEALQESARIAKNSWASYTQIDQTPHEAASQVCENAEREILKLMDEEL